MRGLQFFPTGDVMAFMELLTNGVARGEGSGRSLFVGVTNSVQGDTERGWSLYVKFV